MDYLRNDVRWYINDLIEVIDANIDVMYDKETYNASYTCGRTYLRNINVSFSSSFYRVEAAIYPNAYNECLNNINFRGVFRIGDYMHLGVIQAYFKKRNQYSPTFIRIVRPDHETYDIVETRQPYYENFEQLEKLPNMNMWSTDREIDKNLTNYERAVLVGCMT